MKGCDFLRLECSECGHVLGQFLRERTKLRASDIPCVTSPDSDALLFVTEADVQAAADLAGWLRKTFTVCRDCKKAGKTGE